MKKMDESKIFVNLLAPILMNGGKLTKRSIHLSPIIILLNVNGYLIAGKQSSSSAINQTKPKKFANRILNEHKKRRTTQLPARQLFTNTDRIIEETSKRAYHRFASDNKSVTMATVVDGVLRRRDTTRATFSAYFQSKISFLTLQRLVISKVKLEVPIMDNTLFQLWVRTQ